MLENRVSGNRASGKCALENRASENRASGQHVSGNHASENRASGNYMMSESVLLGFRSNSHLPCMKTLIHDSTVTLLLVLR